VRKHFGGRELVSLEALDSTIPEACLIFRGNRNTPEVVADEICIVVVNLNLPQRVEHELLFSIAVVPRAGCTGNDREA
jgi:hypothetical protein